MKLSKYCDDCFFFSNKYDSCRYYPAPYIVNSKCMSKFIMKK